MMYFRIILIALIVWIYAYTGITIANHGWNLMPIFFGDMMAMSWPGQFNADFMCFLILASIWVSWRNRFSAIGIALGVCQLFLGISFLAPYLLFLTYKANGDMKVILIGNQIKGSEN